MSRAAHAAPAAPFAPQLLADAAEISAAVARLEAEGAVSLALLGPEDCAALLAAASDLSFREARPVVGEGERAVYQDFDICMDIPPESPFRDLARALDGLLDASLARLDPPPVARPFVLNDIVVQRYARGSGGITPHRDHVRYTGLVALVVLSGGGEFYIADDRAGSGARPVQAGAGRLVLMRAPGYAGRRDRPFHGLRGVVGPRVAVGLRHDSRAVPGR